ncbi:hypothetical protein EES39_35060 [Streptomyces sp. ADI92-24]|uniref:hypothetical protein n=1 Tax=unclassified Streptomyces TaxID=2593676 RepID=UPI000F4AA131|nr:MULTISPECIES: hypothetical protein [unclassified Streptomyces]ROQ72605.1 hypothetical protein EDD95_5191 [Streptomyces sp. CEV 2-1]RPK34540.1 hypothetical protein EES39_35060 [Streptomyces sp. ADI92-24]
MKLPITIHQARIGSVEFKVIRPAQPLVYAVLTDHDRHLDAYLDQDAARRIGGLWTLAASSPRSLVHLPMRSNRAPSRELPGDGTRQLDLVLLHHSLQFAPSQWKEVRGRLGAGRPQTVTLSDREHTGDAAIDHEARHYRENRDLFHQHLHAETLFMTGSAKVFRETAQHFFNVARSGPGYVPVHPSYPYFCTGLHSNDGILGNAREIHIEYCDEWDS